MKSFRRVFAHSAFASTLFLAPYLAQACVLEIGFSEYYDSAKNKAACEQSINRILYETQKVIDRSAPDSDGVVRIQKVNDGLQFGHPKDEKFLSCEQSHMMTHPFSYYVELGVVDGRGMAGERSGNLCDQAESQINALNLGSDYANRSVPNQSASRGVGDDTESSSRGYGNSTAGAGN